jgi:hypothetical protein
MKKPGMISWLACTLPYIVFIHCGASPPSNLDRLFTDWFINPQSTTHMALCKCRLTVSRIDSVVRLIRSRDTVRGEAAILLRDTFNAEYTLGYFTPLHFAQDSLYPLIIYLHGGIGSPRTDKGRRAFDMLRPLADSLPLFLASPSANRLAPWWGPAGLQRILQSVRFMTLHYPIDPDRIILAGVSDGATGCYAAANAIPGPFAGFIAVSGFGGMLPQLGMRLDPRNILLRPIYNVNAGKDEIYDAHYVSQFLDWLSQNGVPVTRTLYQDEKHGFDYRGKEFGHLAELVRAWRRPHPVDIAWAPMSGIPYRADNIVGWDNRGDTGAVQIYGQWHGDTLRIHPGAPRLLTITARRAGSQPIWVTPTGGPTRRTEPLDINTDRMLDIMQYRCVPEVEHCALFKIG